MADERRPVGSVAEETARLLDALLAGTLAWTRRRTEGRPTTHTGVTHPRTRQGSAEPCPTCGHVPSAAHATTGDGEVCHLCPVCQLLRVVRTVRPETLDRLGDLAAAVTETLRDAAASRWRETGSTPRQRSRAEVQDIEIEGDEGGHRREPSVGARARSDGGGAMSGQLAIGIDIGGTKVAGGAVDAAGRVVARARRDTPHRSMSPDVVEDTIVAVVNELVETVRVSGSARSWPSGSARPASSRRTGPPSSSPRTCRGATSHFGMRCLDGSEFRSRWTTTPTPRRGRSGSSGRRAARAT